MGRRRKATRSKKQKEQSRSRWGMIAVAAIIVIAVAGLANLLLDSLRGPTAPEPIAGVHEHPPQERGHSEDEIEAGPLPPVDGIHNPVWQNCGIYDEPIEVEHAVHSIDEWLVVTASAV